MLALLVYRSAELVTEALPVRYAERLAIGLAQLAWALHLPARKRIERNLRWLAARSGETPAAPPLAGSSLARQARAAFEHFALSITDFLRLSRLRSTEIRDRVEVRGEEHLAAAERSGRGVIVMSAHSGCWEWGAAFLAALGPRVHLVARPHASVSVERFFAARRARWRVARLCGQPLWAEASRALRRREWVALAGDRFATRRHAGGAGPSVPAWVAALARRTGALIVPALMVRLGDGRYAACFDRPLSPEACVGGGYRDALARLLRDHAEQWSAFEPLPPWLLASE